MWETLESSYQQRLLNIDISKLTLYEDKLKGPLTGDGRPNSFVKFLEGGVGRGGGGEEVGWHSEST